MSNSVPALNALNFFMADVRDGLGPFLGVFLQERGWSAGTIGVVMTIGGLAGMIATPLAGALVDSTTAKRGLLVASALMMTAATLIVLFWPAFLVTAAAQIASGIAGAVIAPAIAGTTLGLVRSSGFAHQLGRNEAFNHAGNAIAAILGGIAGYTLGLVAVFVLMCAMAVGSIVASLMIDPAHIDHDAARGLGGDEPVRSSGFGIVFQSVPLLVLAATLALFHLGNAAMLPLLGQRAVAIGAGDASAFTAGTVVVAQATMIPMALLAARLAQTRGYWLVVLLALLALPLRGAIAGAITADWVLLPVQVLDGVGAGLLGVATPGLVARILAGTPHVNAGLGVVLAVQGVGAALSTTVGGFVAEHVNYDAAFLVLGGIACIALAIWLMTASRMRKVCRPPQIEASVLRQPHRASPA